MQKEALRFFEVQENKRQYLLLLLLADEQESMIDRYLDRGTMYALEDDGVKAVCVVTGENGTLEIKNLAVEPASQRKGYGRAMIGFLRELCRGRYGTLLAGTGDSPLTVPCYEKCGFTRAYRVKDFFTQHYDQPIFEDGVQLADMLYFQMKVE